MDLTTKLQSIIEQVRVEFASDPRLAIYDVAAVNGRDAVVLIGVTSEPAAAEALHRRIALLDDHRPVRDEVVRMPVEDGPDTHALVTAASAPMLAGPMISEATVSQTLLGHHLLVLRERNHWLHCRSSDGYLGWVHLGYVHRTDSVQARRWAAGEEGEACVSLGAEVLEDGEVRARLPWGARVVRVAADTVALPNGTVGRFQGTLVPVAELPHRFPLTGEAVVETAERWIGAPYLWGGIIPAGVDCSGLVQAAFRLHGLELPRDSDLQALTGEPVQPDPDFGNLRAGDLLFFAEDATRITHVAISRGGSRIIHSAVGNGGVQRNDLMGSLALEQDLRSLFVCARRVLPI